MKRMALLALAVVLAGCGGSPSTAPEPTLPAPLAARLAAYADETARLAAAGDECGAHEQAVALQRVTVAAINAHQVPGALQEPLQASANDLVNRIVCTPAPATTTTTTTTVTTTRDDDGGKKHGKGRGHKKKGEK